VSHIKRVSEIRVLRRIFGPKRDEVVGGWRRLHNEELRNLYASPNIVKSVKSRRMIRAGHVARMGQVRNTYKFPDWVDNEIYAYKNEHSLRSNTEGYGGKTH